MASDITANDLIGIFSKTKMISKSPLPIRLPTEVWKGTCTFRGRRRPAFVRNIDVSQLLVTHVRLPRVAIKIMRQLMLPENESSLARLLREARTLYTCKHPNLVRLIGIFYDKGMHAPCLITQFYKNGSIMEYLAKTENDHDAVRMNLACFFLRQIFAGLAHLHSKSIVHGNLKPTNILIDNNGNAKLAEYGLSPILRPPCQHCSPWILELPSIRYKAPELISPGRNYIQQPPTAQSDVWAASMVGLEVRSQIIVIKRWIVIASLDSLEKPLMRNTSTTASGLKLWMNSKYLK
ncbi:kinase-like domain-containing protein [Suillus occidentalis]|nr:kinase-like domain-containing protein [Suillus occidentalis]